eukprot:TRINITY_DN6139_c0_g1_i1.p1 TRINITY_DN6139_c0_g1~~TRINITY_DN6139_c0_g1_i1.p1  ORF type:complete len:363 (-),score=45.42 TRINITY_DN6139_c0_g1_i1:51-1139(-)
MSWAKYADSVTVIDTGSTDGTIESFEKMGVQVFPLTLNPFRYDVARNFALNSTPGWCQVLISSDMDNVLQPIHRWRQIVERAWGPDVTRLSYKWFYNAYKEPEYYNYDKSWIHASHSYKWHYPVHEKLLPFENVTEKVARVEELSMMEYPDLGKNRNYTELLFLTLQEHPESAIHWIWLAIEYHNAKWSEGALNSYLRAIDGVSIPGFRWVDALHVRAFVHSEICFYLSQPQHKDKEGAYKHCDKGIEIDPSQRDPWMAAANSAVQFGDWWRAYLMAQRALAIPDYEWFIMWPTNECEWSWCPYDIASISAFNLGLYAESCTLGKKGYEIARLKEPAESTALKRFGDNLKWFCRDTETVGQA